MPSYWWVKGMMSSMSRGLPVPAMRVLVANGCKGVFERRMSNCP